MGPPRAKPKNKSSNFNPRPQTKPPFYCNRRHIRYGVVSLSQRSSKGFLGVLSHQEGTFAFLVSIVSSYLWEVFCYVRTENRVQAYGERCRKVGALQVLGRSDLLRHRPLDHLFYFHDWYLHPRLGVKDVDRDWYIPGQLTLSGC